MFLNLNNLSLIEKSVEINVKDGQTYVFVFFIEDEKNFNVVCENISEKRWRFRKRFLPENNSLKGIDFE